MGGSGRGRVLGVKGLGGRGQYMVKKEGAETGCWA